jgi:hypothetical protein
VTFSVQSVAGMECIYCGDIARDRDHVIPHSLTDDIKRTWFSNEVVPACKDCNMFLFNKALFTIADRAAAIVKRLKRKISKLGPEWKQEELDALGPTLKRYVVSQQLNRRLLHSRLARAESVAKLTKLTPEEFWESEEK